MRLLAIIIGLMTPAIPMAFESDVHFGLTRWLAIQAGFAPELANIIATGNQRMDAGIMDVMEPVFEYACLFKDDEAARRVQALHYPGTGPVPGPRPARAVQAGAPAARARVEEISRLAQDKAGFLLHKFGQALHGLQDSWAHQGTPSRVSPGGGIECAEELAWGAPEERGGANSHEADLTRRWPQDVVQMASAVYEYLRRYPAIRGQRRAPAAWSAIHPHLDDFIRASSKSAKRAWFNAQGIDDTAFLEGISLPDGDAHQAGHWPGRWLPSLESAVSRQWSVSQEARDFFHQLFIRWLSPGADLSTADGADVGDPARGLSQVADTSGQLRARLRLWRFRDHGSAAALAHQPGPFDAAQLAQIEELTKGGGYARYESLTDAFFPQLAKGPEVSALLPYVIHELPVDGEVSRIVAVAKLKHLPYDALAFVAERTDGRYRLVSVASLVDH